MTPNQFGPAESNTAVVQIVEDGLCVTITCRVQVGESSTAEAPPTQAVAVCSNERPSWNRRMSWTERRFSEALGQ